MFLIILYPSECLCVQLLSCSSCIQWFRSLIVPDGMCSLPAAVVLLWQYQIPAVLWETISLYAIQISFIVWICLNPVSHPTKKKTLTFEKTSLCRGLKVVTLKGWKFLPCVHTAHNQPFYLNVWLITEKRFSFSSSSCGWGNYPVLGNDFISSEGSLFCLPPV